MVSPGPSIKVSVNVSPAQFRNPNFDVLVSDILQATGFPPGRLELEVTESYFIVNPEQARRAIDTIRTLGIAVSLDDFGTGYSSIGYLRSFNFDKLKLDRSLIIGLAEDERVQRLVKATIALAEALDLTVTAEESRPRRRRISSGTPVVPSSRASSSPSRCPPQRFPTCSSRVA